MTGAPEPPPLGDDQLGLLVHETYAVHHLLYNLGFSVDEVFVGARQVPNREPPGLYALVLLKAQEKEFVYTLTRLSEGDVDRFAAAWDRFARAQPSMDRLALDFLVAATETLYLWHLIVQKLVEKGFAIAPEHVAKFGRPIVAGEERDPGPGSIVLPTPMETLRWRSKRR